MAGEPLHDRKLVELYYRYVGEPERMRDVYGYWLFLLGSLGGLAGVLIYQYEQLILAGDLAVREVAIIASAVGLAVALFGIIVLLPVRRRGILASLVGLLISFGGVALFSQIYPHAWYVEPDYSAEVIAVYAAGIMTITAVAVLVPIITGERGLLVEPELGIGRDEPPILQGKATEDAFYAVYETPTNDWTWRMIQRNAIAEGADVVPTDTDARLRIEEIRETVGSAGLLDLTTSSFRLYRTPEDEWRWSLAGQDGGLVARSPEPVSDRDRVESTVTFLKDRAPEADVVEIRGAAFDTYQDEDERWHWRLIDDERRPLASSPDSHPSPSGVERASEHFVDRVGDARVLAIETIGIELFEEEDGWSWRVVTSADGTIVTSASQVSARQHAETAAMEVAAGLSEATIVEYGTPGYELFRADGGWQWRLRTETDHLIAERSGDAVSAEKAREAAERTQGTLEGATEIEYEGADYEVYPDGDGWRWRVVSAERDVLAESAELFEDAEAADSGATHVRERALAADLIEFDRAAFQQYESDGEWRWRLIDEDGQVMADSGEEYASKEAVRDGMETLKEHAPNAEMLEIDTAAFEIYRTETDRYAWRLIDEGGHLVAEGATEHETRKDARDAVDFLLEHVEMAAIRRMADPVFQLYSHDDGWRARLIDTDGTILANTTDAAPTRDDARDRVQRIRSAGQAASVDVVGDVTVQLRQDGGWHWQLIDPDRQRIAVGERTYETREAAVGDAELLIEEAAPAPTFDIGEGLFWVHEDEAGWGWRLIDQQRNELGLSPSPYETEEDALDAIELIKTRAPEAGSFEIDTLAYETFREDDAWRWRLLDAEENVLAVSTGKFESREDALAATDSTRDTAEEASILEIEEAAFEFHKREDGWVWRLLDEEGSQIAESVEAHETRQAAREEMLSAKNFGPDGELVVTW